MLRSIQDYAKRINSSLPRANVFSLLITALFLLCFTVFLYIKRGADDIPVSYIPNNSPSTDQKEVDSRPFASKNGKTYTFSWCSGSTNISLKNKIYFVDEATAQASGRTLSKLCTK
ncbi:MAG: hypothetical protein WC444_01215 [Candidatus Paceibacterota bacterium]